MIYMITNTINNKRYIGKTTKTIEERWYHHCKKAEYGVDTLLYRAIRKYGTGSFVVQYLCDGLDDEEIVMIGEHQPEYNMTTGGEGGDTSNSINFKESLIRRRSYSGENNPNYGKRGKDSPNYGKTRSDQQKANYRLGYKGKRVPVLLNGIYYESIAHAAQCIGMSQRYVRRRNEHKQQPPSERIPLD